MVNVQELVQNTIDGIEDPLKAYAILKDLENTLKSGLKEIQPVVLEEAHKYNEKSFEHQGFKFEKRNGSRRFDFKHLEEWQEANNHLKGIEEKYKQAYLSKENGLLSATEEGEVLELPKVTYSSDSVIVKKS